MDDGSSPIVEKSYRGMIGLLLYLTASRPDSVFSVGLCARFQSKSNETHLKAVKRIWRYLKHTPSHFPKPPQKTQFLSLSLQRAPSYSNNPISLCNLPWSHDVYRHKELCQHNFNTEGNASSPVPPTDCFLRQYKGKLGSTVRYERRKLTPIANYFDSF